MLHYFYQEFCKPAISAVEQMREIIAVTKKLIPVTPTHAETRKCTTCARSPYACDIASLSASFVPAVSSRILRSHLYGSASSRLCSLERIRIIKAKRVKMNGTQVNAFGRENIANTSFAFSA